MLVLLIARFDVSFDEWRIVFDQDEPIRHQFANDFVVGRVDNHTTRLGLSHEIFELHRTN